MENYLIPEQKTQIEIDSIDEVHKSENFLKIMSKRRSIRSFSNKAVQKEVLINAIKTAASAPSGANRQPWHFSLITSKIIKEKIRHAAEEVEYDFYNYKATEEWLNDLKPFSTNSTKTYLTEAPALIAVCSRNFVEENGLIKRSYYPTESTGIAVGFLLTALHTAGLATLTHTPKPMHFLNEVLNLDKSFKPFMIIVVGYPKHPIELPRIQRKSLSEIMKEY